MKLAIEDLQRAREVCRAYYEEHGAEGPGPWIGAAGLSCDDVSQFGLDFMQGRLDPHAMSIAAGYISGIETVLAALQACARDGAGS